MEKLKISLIICAYNEEKYIGECLKQAIENSLGKFFEIIVIDNASTDRTAEIVKKFPGVRMIYEKEKGLTHARQRGFKEAQGDILAFIDADTKIPKGWYEKAEKEFGDTSRNKNLAGLSGPYVYYDIPKWQQFLVKVYWLLAIPFYHIIGYMATGGNFVIRKTVLEKMNGFDTTVGLHGEDADTARRASKFGKVKFKSDFFIYTSGRRFTGHGLFKTAWIYIINFFSHVIAGKSITKGHIDYR